MSGTILDIFSGMVAQYPERECVFAGGRSLTFASLDRASNSLAAALRARGMEHGDHVGIGLDRTVDMMVALFAVWKVGAAYVPIDPTYPRNRVQHMISDSGAKLVITQTMFDASIFGPGTALFLIDKDWTESDVARPQVAVGPGDLAYTIYTSGSTGKPKGVQVNHGNLLNFLLSMQRMPGLGPEDRLLAVTTLSFDIAGLELFLPLITGAAVEIASRVLASDGSALAERLDAGGVTVMQATPATWRMLLDAGWKGGTGLKALVGGEALPKDIVPGLLARVDALWNMYGPTETTIWSTCFRVESAEAPILIGKPIDNTTVHVVDESLRELPKGEAGELLIGGAGVACGYFNRPELTAERFIPDTLGDSGGRLYRTGDLVKMLPDGNLQYINRLDNQIKLRGFRIELGEIEAVVARHEAVSQCVVALRNDGSGEPRLIGYVRNEGVRTTTAGELRAFAQRELPEFMTPSVWVFVDAMPLTPNGKIDRNALPEPSTDRPELGQAFVPPRSPLEKHLAGIWKKMLGLDKIGTRDRFFDLGGNSIKAIQFVDQLGNRMGQKISMPGFFGAPCIAEFAELLERDHADGVDRLLGRSKGDRKVVEGARNEANVRDRRVGEHEDLAIVGMAVRLPGASNTASFWANLRDGVESRYQVTAEDLIAAGLDPAILDDPTYVPACFPLDDVDKFDAAFFGINPRDAQMMDPQHRIFLECCWTALEDAGYAPDNCPKLVGVFAGIARNAYQWHNVASVHEYRINSHDYSILLGNDKDFLSTRVSHKLNLRGPSMTVLAACSGSGAALHQARLALLNGDCDMALVGGGRIMSPHKVGYHYVDGNVLSADGRVHAFDARASGMVRGNGVVAILIKRLSDAIEDGDDIKALIKSTAVNNDGGSKASFTAPSVPGQAAVIRRALVDADVSPDTISYVEAHGTGTRLGDPIEVAALAEAWSDRRNGNQFCPIGSSKTNVGHLDAGACVTGIVKTALGMRHRLIPPSLNFETPNPLIDFAGSPFYVNTSLAEWKPVETPRRAAVSSFGVGGTNVHVIMEEAPERRASGDSRPRQLLLLSAKRAGALALQAHELASALRGDETLTLADVAYTLQVGRSGLPLRHAIVCSDRDDAIDKLEKLAHRGVSPQPAEEGAPVVYMFPGQGSQHVNMARELYDHEAVYRVHFEHCSRALKPILGLDLRDLVYPEEGADVADLAERLKRTEIAQLALFTVEYSLAKVWQSWGVLPASMIGHSVGEFVAACVAGVIELHDCLRVLHARASLMGSMPPGDMLAVALSVDELKPRLTEGVNIAASNAPEITVVSGRSERITAFRNRLENDGIDSFPLHTSHAFHSEMMEPILEPFMKSFDGVTLSAPKIPFISSMTGTWITDEQATSPEYWAQQLRNAVLFSKGIGTIREEDDPIFLEVGPGTALSSSVRKHDAGAGRRFNVVTTLSAAQRPEPALETTLAALGSLWGAGVAPDWSSFYASESRLRVTLPTYPFERVRHWIEPALGWAGKDSADKAAYDDVMRRLYAVEESAQPAQTAGEPLDHLGRTRQRLTAMLFEMTGIPIDAADEGRSFLDLGFDSLLLTQVSGRLTREFGISLRFWELIEEYSSVDTLAEYLAQHTDQEVPVAVPQAEPVAVVSQSVGGMPVEAMRGALPTVAPASADGLAELVARQALIIDAIAEKLRSQARRGDTSKAAAPVFWHDDSPPVPGARLGRDRDGSPGWFMEDPDCAGRFVRFDDV